jgi:hypothetical protein
MTGLATSEILPRLARIPKLEEEARVANPKARVNKGQTEEERMRSEAMVPITLT